MCKNHSTFDNGNYFNSAIRVQFVFTIRMRNSLLRKVREHEFVCSQKLFPAHDFRGLTAPIPPLKWYQALYKTHTLSRCSLFLKRNRSFQHISYDLPAQH